MAGLSATIVRSSSASTYAVDLTAKGGADYIVANSRTTYKRKDVASLFGTVVRTWSFNDNDKNPSGYTVTGTDGKPSPATFSITTLYGGYIEAGQYWEITAPAGLAERTLQAVVFSDFGPSFQVQATLSDGSVSPLTLDRNTNGTGSGNYGLYELDYSAGSDGQTVTIRITGSGGQINVGWLWLSNEATGTQTLTPNLFTNTNTFYIPTVNATYGLTPALYTNTNTFYNATVTLSNALSPALYTNTNTFYNATVATSYTASAGLFTNNSTFYSANVTYSNTLTPELLSNTSTFYDAVIGSGLSIAPSLFSNAQTFYSPSVDVGAVGLTPSLVTNASQFYSPVAQQEGGTQLLAPNLVNNNNAFFNSTFSTTYTVSAELVTNASVIYAPVATASNQIVAPLLTNNQTFYDSTIIFDQVLLAGLLINTNAFYNANLRLALITPIFAPRNSNINLSKSIRAANLSRGKR